MAKRTPLVCQQLENSSREALGKFQDIIRQEGGLGVKPSKFDFRWSMKSFINFLSITVPKCPLVISNVYLSCFHESQPIPFDNNLPISTGGLKRPGLVSPLMRL